MSELKGSSEPQAQMPTEAQTPAGSPQTETVDTGAYRVLDGERTVATIYKLQQRIEERFPESGLRRVCGELHQAAKETKHRCDWIARPNYGIRAGVAALVLLAAAGTYLGTRMVKVTHAPLGVSEFIQVLEASINDLILFGAAVAFLITVESRIKRRRVLQALNELRAITHVIDMHQLTKDPGKLNPTSDTRSSPRLHMTDHQLNRYLDYCSEMLALTGKVAALYAQQFPDTVVLSTVTELEQLTVGLSTKVWQKISLLRTGNA